MSQTYIERATKNRDNPYGLVLRSTFDGSDLSFQARGALVYILMKPDDWRVQIKDLMREGKIGRDKAYGILKELIDKGYAQRIEVRNDKGLFDHVLVKVYETPADNHPHPENPYTDNPNTVQPHTENTEHTNKGVLPNTDLVLNTEEDPAAQQQRTDTATSKRKTSKLKKEPEPPHPAIQAYRDTFLLSPKKGQIQAIIDADPPIANWVRAVREWNLRGFNPLNIKGILEWADDPSLINKRSPSQKSGSDRNNHDTIRNLGGKNGNNASDNSLSDEEVARIRADRKARKAAAESPGVQM